MEAQCSTRAFQRPGADGLDETPLFRNRYELPGRHQPSNGVIPAQQRLHAQDRAGADIDLGLILENELPIVDGPRELILDLELVAHALAHLGVEQLEPITPGLLGRIECDACLDEQSVRTSCLSVRRDGYPDAQGRRRAIPAVEWHGTTHGGKDSLGHPGRRSFITNLVEKDGEFVPSQPRQTVLLANHFKEHLGYVTQHLVPAAVTESVIGVSETINVEKKKCDGAISSARPGERIAQPFPKSRLRRQPGKRLVKPFPFSAPILTAQERSQRPCKSCWR
jgi:hypothetical protein